MDYRVKEGGKGGKAKDFRKNVLQRLRDPKANNTVKMGQAYQYFMPALAGHGGDDVMERHPDGFLYLLDSQYEMLQLWAEGEYEYEPEGFKWYTHFEQIPIKYQPEALSKASLEWCIGGAFYPGIEMTYMIAENAKLWTEASKGGPLFRVKGLEAGDLTKNMALPWQADFFECQDHWWPSQRPDQVLPLAAFEKIKNNPKELEDNSATYDFLRENGVDWDRGFRENEPYTDDDPNRARWGNMDMVDFWNKLGMIVPKPRTEIFKIGGEEQKPKERTWRVEIDRQMFESKPVPPAPHPPVKKTDLQKLEDKENDLIQLLQAALFVELTTIPPYLYAAWSVRTNATSGPTRDTPVWIGEIDDSLANAIKKQILFVGHEEMLHLSLVANIIGSIKFKRDKENPRDDPLPQFYKREMTPFYPNPLPHHYDPELPESERMILVHLQKADAENINTFVRIESPAPKEEGTGVCLPDSAMLGSIFCTNQRPNLASLNVRSIAELYDKVKSALEKALKDGIIEFGRKGHQLAHGMGFTPKNGKSGSRGGLIYIHDLDDAKKAIDEICEQGEGHKVTKEDFKKFNNPEGKVTMLLEETDINSPHYKRRKQDDNNENKNQDSMQEKQTHKRDRTERKAEEQTEENKAKEMAGTVGLQDKKLSEKDMRHDDHNDFGSHFERFKWILTMVEDPQSVYSTYNVRKDPTGDAYHNFPDVAQLNKAFNACYCLLMVLLQKSWSINDNKNPVGSATKRNIFVGAMPTLMRGVLSPLGQFMMTLPVGGGETAGPSFEFYNFETPFEVCSKEMIKLAVDQTVKELKEAKKLFGERFDTIKSIIKSVKSINEVEYDSE